MTSIVYLYVPINKTPRLGCRDILTLPAELSRRYETLLRQQRVASQHGFHYARWLRYYWDFCHKYGFAPNDRQSFPPFDKKLRTKNQSEFQRQQAQHAVSLYYASVLGNGTAGSGESTS